MFLDALDEIRDRHHATLYACQDGLIAAMPNEHDAIDGSRKNKWDVPTFRNLLQISDKERAIDYAEGYGNRQGSGQRPAPNVTHGYV